jgi:hypothetical protein
MFWRDYLRVLIPLACLLAIYRVVAIPFIEPTRTGLAPIGPAGASLVSAPWWNYLFAESSWQRNQPKVLETPQGILLFEKWDKLSPDRWKLYPLTILIPQNHDQAMKDPNALSSVRRRAIRIDSPQGAEIQFRDAVDWTSGRPPPVIGGQLNGRIEIDSPPSEGSASTDSLHIQTSDLRIDRRHVWTTKPITMRLGRSYVEGRDLSIYLDQDLLSSKQPVSNEKDSPFSGLDNLELVYVDKVHIDLPDGGLFAERLADTNSAKGRGKAYAEAKCRGSFQFFFHESMARLSSKVELKHVLEEFPDSDRFESDRLDLHFAWKPAAGSHPDPANRDWSIDRIEAVGSQGMDPDDPTRWVRLEAPSIASRGDSRWLRVDLSRGRVSMANHLPGQTPNAPAQVYLQRDTMVIQSPEIEYESQRLRPASPGNPASDKNLSLGRLWAAGPGRASLVGEDGDAWKLWWAKSLDMKPEGAVDRLTIDGSANARSERQGRFSAETVDIWLRSISDQVIGRVREQTGGYAPSTVVPERLHAAGTVIVHSPQLRAQVADLQAWFEYPEIEIAIQSLKHSPENRQALQVVVTPRQFTQQPTTDVISRPATASPLATAFSNLTTMANGVAQSNITAHGSQPRIPGPGQMASAPIAIPSLNGTTNGQTEQVPALPLNVTGETLVAKLSQTSKGLVVNDLALNRNVTITRDQVSSSSDLKLTIFGNQLRMDSSDGRNMDITIMGEPAKFAIGSGAIESTEIHFDQRRQLVWMDQPGIFRIPPEAMSSIQANSASANSSGRPIQPSPDSFAAPGFIGNVAKTGKGEGGTTWLQAPEVKWNGRMHFDGRTAKMDGSIQITGRMATQDESVWHFDGRSQELEVELEQPIEMSGQGSSRATVAFVKLIDKVDLKVAQTDLKGNRRSLEHLEVPELIFLAQQQKWIGMGPGSLRSRRIGNANPGSPQSILSGSPTSAPTAKVANPEAELQCLHLRFGGKMEGNMQAQMMTFYDRVETLLQPILSWDESPDILKIDRLKIGQTTMTCDQLNLHNEAQLSWVQSQIQNQQLKRDASWVVTGAGRVVVDSVNEQGSLSVNANLLQYVALHGVLRVEGDGMMPAEIRQIQNGAEPFQTKMNYGVINLKTGVAELKGVSAQGSLQGVQNKEGTPGGGAPNPVPAFGGGYGIPSSGSPTNSITSPRDTNPFQRQR